MKDDEVTQLSFVYLFLSLVRLISAFIKLRNYS